ncbi:DUF1425 domain-containing protein, partial [Salmonella enterica subsp. enterica serovar Schwarzengrund]
VLAAGATAQPPEMTASAIQPSTSSPVYNERQEPITLHYRFYWHDARGLEMHPLEAPRSLTTHARSSAALFVSAHYLSEF